MKKSIKLLALFATAATLAVSCEKELNNEGTHDSDLTAAHITFTAAAPETRTAFDAKDGDSYPTLWQAGDEVQVWESSAEGGYSIPTMTVTPSADGKTATFEYTGNPNTHYYSVYKISGGGMFFGSDELDITVPSSQYPTATSCDPSAMLLFGDSGEVSADDKEVTLHYKHLTAYGKFSLLNLGENAEDIDYIDIKAGSGFYWIGMAEIHDWRSSLYTNLYNGTQTITINAVPDIDNIWFACYPVNITNSITITVMTTSRWKYEKTIDLTSRPLKFEAGIVSEFKVDMEGTHVM